MDMKGLANSVIGVGIAVLVASLILPIALGQFATTSTTGWQSTWVSSYYIIPIAAILTVVIAFLLKLLITNREG